MTMLDRRRFMLSLLAPLFLHRRAIELQYASAFAAPYLAEQLTRSTRLRVVEQKDRRYAALGDDLIGLVPRELAHAHELVVTAIVRDHDDRLHVYVTEHARERRRNAA
jgi:hypothetical protein